MPLRSMTGFAQVKGELVNPAAAGFGRSESAASPNGRMVFALSL